MDGEESALATKAGSYLSLKAAGNYATLAGQVCPGSISRLKLKFVLPMHKYLPVVGARFKALYVNFSLHIGHSVSTGAWSHLRPG